MTAREQAKFYQDWLLRGSQHPLVPAKDKAIAADLSILLGEWGEFIHQLRGNSHEQQPDSGQVPLPDLPKPGGRSPT